MDIGRLVGKIPKWFHEYRYPIVIALVGLVLLTLPGKRSAKSEPVTVDTGQTPSEDLATELSGILSQIHGVGKVKVMLSVSQGQTTLYHADQNISSAPESSTVRNDTVIITDSDRNETPLITQVIPAKYQGAVVVCQGAEVASVKWAVVEAVRKATGLGADQISVLKMK